uniref:Uncharacterized protein n=1 Tax=Rhizochromulina marina TaxID=1034831 RepID=A0A7S2SDI1_9STRA|mmetsp:Transcript_28600/g.83697  ORF Transcript_28600/g.83697 Transcript_28600/m.83697 type:complete len:336 (+) Transcript_28600:38-1045(+)
MADLVHAARARALEAALAESRRFTCFEWPRSDAVDSLSPAAADLLRCFEALEGYEPSKGSGAVLVDGGAVRDPTLYGVTPASSLLALLEHPVLQALLPDSGIHRGGSCLTLGSSVGWLPFFASYVLRVPGVGVELVESRVQFGQRVLESLALPPPAPVQLHCGDARNSETLLRQASLVFEITSFGDTDLRRAIWRSMADALPQGAIILSYDTAPSGEGLGIDAFTLHQVLRVSTSWTRTQPFHVYSRTTVGGSGTVERLELPDAVEDPSVRLVAMAHRSARFPAEPSVSSLVSGVSPSASASSSSRSEDHTKEDTQQIVGALGSLLGTSRISDFL